MSSKSNNTFHPPTRGAVKKTRSGGSKDDKNLPNTTSRKTTNRNETISSNITNKNNMTMIYDDNNKEIEDLNKKISYNDYINSLFLESLVDEKIEREKTEIDVKMAELAKRLEINKHILRKTQDRLKEMSFLSEQQRLLDENKLYSDELLKHAEDFHIDDLLDNFNENQDLYCNRLLTKNVDLGAKQNGVYEELHAAILNTIQSMEKIKAEYHLDDNEIKTIASMTKQLKECEIAEEQIENNLRHYESIASQVSSDVLEVASIGLGSTLS